MRLGTISVLAGKQKPGNVLLFIHWVQYDSYREPPRRVGILVKKQWVDTLNLFHRASNKIQQCFATKSFHIHVFIRLRA